MDKKIIYDLGANNGDDIPYYLMKADLVVAVEANPALCAIIRQRFAAEMSAGRLVVENCVITAIEENAYVDFYVHRDAHVLSQFPKPAAKKIDSYEMVSLPSKPISLIIADNGTPYYIKIDIEHYDSQILYSLWQANIKPPYISAESHNIQIFSLLVIMGYTSFKLVDGKSVPQLYSHCKVRSISGVVTHSFPKHAAGPFGNDIHGPWVSADVFFRRLALFDLGWKDIHASLVDDFDDVERGIVRYYANNYIRMFPLKIRFFLKRFINKLKSYIRTNNS